RHVYASRPEKRSIVLNGKAWTEGDSPLPTWWWSRSSRM
ncbi:hypothetical protein CQA72_29475, partial [Klebsiella pneumoniae]